MMDPDFLNTFQLTRFWRLRTARVGGPFMHKRSEVCLAFTILVLMALCLYGQATSGNIIGTVADSAGAAIPGAKVTITSQERGTIYNVVTNESGNYIQTQLTSGTYTVEFEAPGFQ